MLKTVLIKKISLLLLLSTTLTILSSCSGTQTDEKSSDTETTTSVSNTQMPAYSKTDDVRELFPEYFDLDASKGLDVYVWQMTAGSFSFGLLEHSSEPRYWLSKELLSLRGAKADQMIEILESYDIPKDKINIIPWQNPLSSYIATYHLVKPNDEEYNRQVKKGYMHIVTLKLFDKKFNYYTSYCDISIEDIDNDGNIELSVMGKYPDSGAKFIYLIYEPYSDQYDYIADMD